MAHSRGKPAGYGLHTQDSLVLALDADQAPGDQEYHHSIRGQEENPNIQEESRGRYHDKVGPSENQPLLTSAASDQPPLIPKDKYYLAQAIFFLIGVGMLFPWNVFITATSFFELKFIGSPFYDNFER